MFLNLKQMFVNPKKLNVARGLCDPLSKFLAVALVFLIPLSTTLTYILLLCIMLAVYGTGRWKEHLKLSVFHPVGFASLGLFLFFCIGVCYASAPIRDSLQMLGKMSKFLFVLLLIPLFVEEKWRRAAIWAFIAAMVITLIASTLKTYNLLGMSLISKRYHNCVFKHHIDTSLLMSMAAFFLGHLLFTEVHRYIKVGILILLLSMTVYVFWVNQGRTGYIVFSSLWLLWIYQRLSFKKALMAMTALFLILMAAYFAPSGLQKRLSSIKTELKLYQKGVNEYSAGMRLEYLHSSLHLIRQKPWVGYGTGGFNSAYSNYAKDHGQLAAKNPHNEYINIWVQWGLVGLLVFMSFIGLVCKTIFSLPTHEKYLAQGVLLGILVGSFLNSFFMDFTPGYFFVTFISIMTAAFISRQGERTVMRNLAPREGIVAI